MYVRNLESPTDPSQFPDKKLVGIAWDEITYAMSQGSLDALEGLHLFLNGLEKQGEPLTREVLNTWLSSYIRTVYDRAGTKLQGRLQKGINDLYVDLARRGIIGFQPCPEHQELVHG